MPMATVNITQAAKLVGLSRSYFQRKYIKAGIVSCKTGDDGHKKIETAELLRVFGELKNMPEGTPVHSDSTVTSEQEDTPKSIPKVTPIIDDAIQLAELKVENRMLKERMAEMKEQHSSQLRLLEHLVENHRPWWKFWK